MFKSIDEHTGQVTVDYNILTLPSSGRAGCEKIYTIFLPKAGGKYHLSLALTPPPPLPPPVIQGSLVRVFFTRGTAAHLKM